LKTREFPEFHRVRTTYLTTAGMLGEFARRTELPRVAPIRCDHTDWVADDVGNLLVWFELICEEIDQKVG